MKLQLNRYDIILAITIIIITVVSLFYVLNVNANAKNKSAIVYYKNEVVHTFDLEKKDLQKFEIKATNGLVKIEAKDGKVRVVEETSKRNICSIQGWSDSTSNPIVCLPNELYIKIESTTEDEVDVFVK